MPDRWKEAHRRSLAGETIQTDEDRWDRGGGITTWVRWELRPWKRVDGTVGGILIFAEDITRRKNTSRARATRGGSFASPHGLFQLSKLSVWWLSLGISIERIRPGHPQQNGRHERMHLTLKTEATRPAGANILQQQSKFDTFLEEFQSGKTS